MSVDTTSLGANLNIRNTVTNRNTIAPVLYSICVTNNSPLVLTGGETHDLNTTDIYQAVCVPGGQGIDNSSSSAPNTISLGSDTSARALELMDHLNLVEVGRTVLLKFYQSNSDGDNAVYLANSSTGTTDHVVVSVEGGSENNSVNLLAGGRCPGIAVLVEASCVSNTAGSEKVLFNVLRGYYLCD